MPEAAASYSRAAGLVGVMFSAVFWGSFMLFIKTKAVKAVAPDPLVIQASSTPGHARLAPPGSGPVAVETVATLTLYRYSRSLPPPPGGVRARRCAEFAPVPIVLCVSCCRCM